MIPVDVWNVHAFILSEERGRGRGSRPASFTNATIRDIQDHDNMDIFKEQILLFRQWMNQQGERNKPLIVSEYGILYHDLFDPPFDEPRVQTFMLATFDYFWTEGKHATLGYPEDENRLVQAWCWYSLDDDNFEGYPSHSHLFDPYTRLRTALGCLRQLCRFRTIGFSGRCYPNECRVIAVRFSNSVGRRACVVLDCQITSQDGGDCSQGFYFQRAGHGNTERRLEIASEHARSRVFGR